MVLQKTLEKVKKREGNSGCSLRGGGEESAPQPWPDNQGPGPGGCIWRTWGSIRAPAPWLWVFVRY